MNDDLKVGIEIKAKDNASDKIKGIVNEAKKLEDAARKLDTFGKTSFVAGTALTAGFGFATKTAAAFESSMKRVKALSGANNEQFEQLSDTARKLGASTVYSATEASEAMQFLSMAGYEANEQIDAMPGLLDLAAASQEELGTTADIVSNVISGFNLEAKESSRIADVLTNQLTGSNVTLYEMGDAMKYAAPMSSALGVAIEETSAAIGLLGDAGIKGGMAGRNLNIIMARMIDPPKETAEALSRLGVSVLDSSGEFRGLQLILSDVKQATDGMTSAQRATTLSQIAGQDAAKSLINLVSQSNTKLVEYTKNNKIQGTAARIAKEQNESFLGTLKELKSAFEELQIQTGNILLPGLTLGLKVLKAIIRLLNIIPAPIKGIAVVMGAVTGIGLLLVGGVSMALSGLINILNVLAPTFLTKVAPSIWANVAAGRAWLLNSIRNITQSRIWTMSLKQGIVWLKANRLAILSNTKALVVNAAKGLATAIKSIWRYTGALAIQKGGLLLSTAANLGFAGSFRALGAAIMSTPIIGWVAGLITVAILLVQNWDKVIATFKKFMGLASKVPGFGWLKKFSGGEPKVAKSKGKMPSFNIGSRFIESGLSAESVAGMKWSELVYRRQSSNTGIAVVHQGEEIAPAGTVSSIMNNTSNSSGVSITYNPTISISGATKESLNSFKELLNAHKNDIISIIQNENQRRVRLAY